ncbi:MULTISPECIES: ATP-binding protein [Paenarthrobacter]|uniref:ATP-binding protein n=1 Tax=Paenarthrobacter ureafaciens TaxID=37931 RepID=A0AAX3EII9_PAEUR|nr:MULTISPECIES: ATP-binding protein [Paenarthrobacter]NKR10255.1 hypothetical protein [Arthrobacter sp. M5]NKR18269.1 hypothetical protein [Arthrobacter sp. M6]OEH57820.1 hypothetical protein A5N13_22090 [Arthrobacter sp. D4]MDO5866106.1 ATP-binding protein [Paenarthrobacter sp. SD-2]MDO5877203.1 ATP-binding protein [Paenarthrobacter sp. SD-1]
MTALPGGAADKEGNRYEHWWTARVVADLLTGSASRLRLEPPGVGGEGIEFEVDRAGVTWGEQVKLRAGNWTINKLKSEGVLAGALTQVQAGRRFKLIVSTESMPFDTLAQRSRDCDSSVEFRTALSSADDADFLKLATIWGITPDEAYVALRSIYVEPYPFENLRQLVALEFRILFSDAPEVVLGEVRNFCDDHMHEQLTAPQIWTHLESKGFHRRHLAGDASFINNLRKTVERHARHVNASRPSIGLVQSAHLDKLRDCLTDKAGKQLVVLDGSAGYGKSTIAAAIAAELQTSGWWVAAANMSVVKPSAATSTKLGDQLGLGDNSPGIVLAGVADGSPGLLIIDQLDAVGTYSGRITEVYDAIAEVLDEVASAPNIKVLLVVRTVDLESDPRFARFCDATTANRIHVDKLSADDVKAKLTECNIPVPGSDVTIELLRTPLHLSIFLRLSAAARQEVYPSLQRLYDRYTDEVRQSIELSVGHLQWAAIMDTLVRYMNENERLSAPAPILDLFPRDEVHALESADVLSINDQGILSFFHESYFDYLFARRFVAADESLLDFVVGSGQHLFRRAQVRQILEHFAATDKEKFRHTVQQLLGSTKVRSHLKEVVVDVLEQVEGTTDDWLALDELAWSDSRIAWRILGILNRPSWFAAADALGKWSEWLNDPSKTDRAFSHLRFIARDHPARVVELVRPYMGASDEWRLRLKSMVEWSLKPESVELAIELLERGDLDDARGPIAVNSDFWSIVFGLARDDLSAAARFIGAYLNRGLTRAQAEGSDDPFETGQLPEHSPSDQVIAQISTKAPQDYLANVLSFVEVVALANQRQVKGYLPMGSRWAFRNRGSAYTVDDKIFDGVRTALIALAKTAPDLCDDYIERLSSFESEELRFLACIALTERGPADKAIDWLTSDTRNFELGYVDNTSWASRSLINRWSGECSEELFSRLEVLVLTHAPEPERPGYIAGTRLRLLSALDSSRMSEAGRQQLLELQRRFPAIQPSVAPRGVTGGAVASPIPDAAAQVMSDKQWMSALQKYTSDKTDWRGDQPVGGAHQLAQTLGQQAEREPERFAKLALGFDDSVSPHAMDAVIRAVAPKIETDLLADLCEHAQRTYASHVGQAICTAAQQGKPVSERMVTLLTMYIDDPDPDREWARTETGTGDNYFGGDIDMAGLNSTRGHVARAAAAILFQSADYLNILRPVVETLAVDSNLGVRSQTAEAVLALMNHEPERAYDLGEALLDADIELYDTRNVERLMSYLLVREPERFGQFLTRGLEGPGHVALRAGRLWALLSYRDSLPTGVPQEVGELPVDARRGAAERFAANPEESADLLISLFNDPDKLVREQSSSTIRYLATQRPSTVSKLVKGFVSSEAFEAHFDDLIMELEPVETIDPELVLLACERALKIAGAEVGDIRTSHSALAQPIVVSVLRVYRQGDAERRGRCLDIIDQLSEVNAYGIAEALNAER